MIHDISQRVGSSTAVWPGDRPCSLAWTMAQEHGDSVNVAAVTMSVHTGTHADGPFHFDGAGSRIGDMPLEVFIGLALVVDAVGRTELDIDLCPGIGNGPVDRILFRTRTRVDEGTFPEHFAALTPGLARWLADEGCRLVGTDAPSVDPFASRTLDAHRILSQNGIAILENLVLSAVAPGRYTLVALPLRLVEADSSPVRAVLLDDQRDERTRADARAGTIPPLATR